jgi:integrase
VNLVHALELVLAVIANDDQRRETTRAQLGTEITRFVSTARILGADTIESLTAEICHQYLTGAARKSNGTMTRPSPATVSNRRSAVRRFFNILRSLGYSAPDPTLDMGRIQKPARAVRPLSDIEHRQVRAAAMAQIFTGRDGAIVALAEVGASISEIATAQISDVDLESRSINLRGSPRTFARTNDLDDWQCEMLERRIDHLGLDAGPKTLVVVESCAATNAPQSISNALAAVIRSARVGHLGVKPDSIRVWGARRVFDATGSVLEVAQFLGSRDLNAAYALTGHIWPPDDLGGAQ